MNSAARVRNKPALSERLIGLVFPQNLYCLCCEDAMEQSRIHGICDNCARKINWLDHDPFRATLDEFAFDHVLACCVYGFYARKMIHALKLHNRPYVAASIGPLMAEKVKLEGMSFTAIVPVPCTDRKRRKRGYNQAELLSSYISEELELPVWKDVLLKTRETPSMRMSTGEERRNLLQGVFGTAENACEKLRGADILLVDDVVTTGSTADACAIALKDAGVRSVSVLCFASTAHGYTAEQEKAAAEAAAEEDVLRSRTVKTAQNRTAQSQ